MRHGRLAGYRLPLSSPSSRVAGPFIILPLTQSSPQPPSPSMLIHTLPQPTQTPPPQPLGSLRWPPWRSMNRPSNRPKRLHHRSPTVSASVRASWVDRVPSTSVPRFWISTSLFNDAFFHNVSDPTMERPSSNTAPLPLESTRSDDQEMGSPSFDASHGDQQSTEYRPSEEHLGDSSSPAVAISLVPTSHLAAPRYSHVWRAGPIIADAPALMEAMFEDEESQSTADWGGSQAPLSIVGPSDRAPIKCRKAITHCNIPAHTCIPIVTVCRAVEGGRVQSLSMVMFPNHQRSLSPKVPFIR